jgi:hypothetical protein
MIRDDDDLQSVKKTLSLIVASDAEPHVAL